MLQEDLQRDGFAIVNGALTESEIIPALEALSSPELARSRAGTRHVLQNPTVAALARHPELLGMVQQVLGAAAQPFRATLFDKSASSNWLVAWHQDTSLPLRHRKEVPGWGPWSVKAGVTYSQAPASRLGRLLALRVHFDDSTQRNGPLRVLPTSHRFGVLAADKVQDLARQLRPFDCLVRRGGVLAMRPLLVHASSKSIDTSCRRVLHIEYTESTDVGDGLELTVA